MRYTQPQSGPAQIDPDIGADFAWIASVGKLVGPSTSNVSKTATKAGIAINSGYAIVAAPIPSMHTTTWTECGVALLDSTNAVYSLSARSTGQSVNFQPASNRVDLIIWTLVDVFITGTLPVGIVHYVVRRVGSAHTVWLNGKLYGTASSASAPIASSGILPAIGAQAASGGSIGLTPLTATTGMLSVVRTQRALPDAQCLALSNNHWQLFRSSQRVMLAAAGGTDTPVSPGVGALALTGYAPLVTQSANLSLTPGTGSIGITGYAPTITQPQTVTPGLGSLAITGYAPTVTQAINQSILPGAGSLALSGYAPSIAQSANQLAQPAAGSLSLTGYAPLVAQSVNQSIAPNVGSLTITGFAPTVEQASASPNLQPGAGMLSIVGYAPTVEQRDPSANVGGGGAGDWRSARDFADRLDKASRPPKPTKAAKKKRREQLEEVALELLPDLPAARLIAPIIAQAVYRKEAAAVARWTPPQAMLPVIKPNASAVEQAAALEAEALAAEFDAGEAIREMVEQWQKNEAIARELEREAEEESEIEMLLLG